MKKFKKLQIVVYEPGWVRNDLDLKDSILKWGEHVLYLGEIPNVPGHCAVARHFGEVVWLVHPEDFRHPKKDEL